MGRGEDKGEGRERAKGRGEGEGKGERGNGREGGKRRDWRRRKIRALGEGWEEQSVERELGVEGVHLKLLQHLKEGRLSVDV